MALPLKQKLFVKEFIIDGNATRAAKAAGYSDHTAAEQGCRLLKNVHIKRAIDRGMGSRIRRLDITADRIIEEIGSVAFADVTRFAKKTMRIKTSDKIKALELLAKNQKLLTDVQETTGKDGGPQVIVMLPAKNKVEDDDSNKN